MKKPNTIVIVMDTQRAANMGCYGYPKDTTPNIDAIAREGVTCLNNISPGSWTLPSHASMWTGKCATSHGADLRHEYLEPGLTTLPEVLTGLGYETGGVCSNQWASHPAGNTRGFSWFPDSGECGQLRRDYSARVEELLAARGEEHDKCSLLHTLIAQDWIEKRRKAREPFLLFINCAEPHLRCWPPQPFRKRFLPKPVSDDEAAAVEQSAWKLITGVVKNSARDWRIVKALNDGCTATLDARLGILFDYLKQTDLMDDTILVVTSDHGDELGEHPPAAAHIMNVYDTVLRVPLVLRYPRAIPPGKEIRRLTQTLDLFPTLMEILGCRDRSILSELQGISILNAVRGKGYRTWALGEHDRPLQCFERFLSQVPDADLRWADRVLKAYYKGNHKYIWSSNGDDELYHLPSDPQEQRNLASRDPKRVARMKQELEDLLLSFPRRNYPDYLNEAPQKRGRESTENRLRAWGLYNDLLPEQGRPTF